MGENPSEFKGPENPVENVSWDDYQAFLKTLNAQPAVQASGLAFRLPKASEAKFSARAGAKGILCYCKLADGTNITYETRGEVVWFRDTDGSNDVTHPVGQKKPNAFGLYDVFGNVEEWTDTAANGDAEFPIVLETGRMYISSDCHGVGLKRSERGNHIGFRLCADRRAD